MTNCWWLLSLHQLMMCSSTKFPATSYFSSQFLSSQTWESLLLVTTLQRCFMFEQTVGVTIKVLEKPDFWKSFYLKRNCNFPASRFSWIKVFSTCLKQQCSNLIYIVYKVSASQNLFPPALDNLQIICRKFAADSQCSQENCSGSRGHQEISPNLRLQWSWETSCFRIITQCHEKTPRSTFTITTWSTSHQVTFFEGIVSNKFEY